MSEKYLFSADGRLINQERTDFNKRNLMWTDLSEVSPDLIQKIIRQEDHRFYSHFGVDFAAIGSTVIDNALSLFSEKKFRGASTISMQLAKILFKINTRSIFGKFRQMQLAVALEIKMSKNQILEAYLNSISLSGESQGIGTASLTLFNKTAAYLNESEQLKILSLIKKPIAAKNQSFENLAPIQLAPHYHHYLLQDQANYKPQSQLDYELQSFAIHTVRKQLEELKNKNVHDAGVLVLNNKNKTVLAYVGNSGSDFSSTPYVDMVQSERQIGSTVKPFLYGTAFDKNIIKLNSWIEDSPVDIVFENGTYSPKNHDQQFHGWVHPATALASSLNVPAVKVIQLVGTESLWTKLKDLNFHLDREPDYYGPSMALGSFEASLWTLTHAFQSFALTESHVFSPETKMKISWILSHPQNRSLTFGQDSILNTPGAYAVKTGTSKDMKDNWCVGFNKDFTVGVWVGNSDSSPMENVLGVTGAAPIWRDIIDYLAKNKKSTERLVTDEQEKLFIAEEANSTEPQVFGRSKILSPAANSIYAIDPAIPLKFQKIILEADGPQKNLKWIYKGTELKSKALSLEKGHQKIELFRENKKVDEATFLVK
ncbi:MAG: transglycosylase domain-containing protein [Pseudobdellovibrio sp.]